MYPSNKIVPIFLCKYKSKIKILSTFPERASEELAKQQSNLLVYIWTYTKRQVNA